MEKKMVEKKAESVAGELGLSGFAFDPLLIVGVITALIQLYKACNLTPAQAKKRTSAPRLLDRVVLRREIRKYPTGMSAMDEDALHAAILDVGKSTTTEEFRAMFDEVS